MCKYVYKKVFIWLLKILFSPCIICSKITCKDADVDDVSVSSDSLGEQLFELVDVYNTGHSQKITGEQSVINKHIMSYRKKSHREVAQKNLVKYLVWRLQNTETSTCPVVCLMAKNKLNCHQPQLAVALALSVTCLSESLHKCWLWLYTLRLM